MANTATTPEPAVGARGELINFHNSLRGSLPQLAEMREAQLESNYGKLSRSIPTSTATDEEVIQWYTAVKRVHVWRRSSRSSDFFADFPLL